MPRLGCMSGGIPMNVPCIFRTSRSNAWVCYKSKVQIKKTLASQGSVPCTEVSGGGVIRCPYYPITSETCFLSLSLLGKAWNKFQGFLWKYAVIGHLCESGLKQSWLVLSTDRCVCVFFFWNFFISPLFLLLLCFLLLLLQILLYCHFLLPLPSTDPGPFFSLPFS